MTNPIEIQLTFNEAAYPSAARALLKFGSARHRSDYLKTVLEAHFRTLESAENPTPQYRPPMFVATSKQKGAPEESVVLDAPDVERTFSSFFK